MRFGNFHIAYFLWVSVGLVFFFAWSLKRKQEMLERFADKNLIKDISPSRDSKRQRFKAYLVIITITLVIVSLMRPQWGFKWEEVKKKGIDILIAIDTSKSMLARDVKPNRLERSKLSVKDLIKKLKGDRVGLIAFSGSAFLQCPLTSDYSGFVLSLNSLNVNSIPVGGTSLTGAIKEALKIYKTSQSQDKLLVLITDGEDLEGNAMREAEKAKSQGIKIYCIGIGTEEGDIIPVIEDDGRKTFLKDLDGNVVKTRLDENLLKDIALTTGGVYVRATGAEFGLDYLYRTQFENLEKQTFEDKVEKRYTERFQIPLFFAFLLLVTETLMSERKRIK